MDVWYDMDAHSYINSQVQLPLQNTLLQLCIYACILKFCTIALIRLRHIFCGKWPLMCRSYCICICINANSFLICYYSPRFVVQFVRVL